MEPFIFASGSLELPRPPFWLHFGSTLVLSGLFPHSSRWGDPDDMEDSPLLQYLAEVNSREVSLEELDDRFAVDRWLRETAGG